MHLVLKHPKIILSSIKCQNTLRVHFLSKSQAISKFVVKDALRSSNFKNPKIFLLKFQIIEMFWKTTQPTILLHPLCAEISWFCYRRCTACLRTLKLWVLWNYEHHTFFGEKSHISQTSFVNKLSKIWIRV